MMIPGGPWLRPLNFVITSLVVSLRRRNLQRHARSDTCHVPKMTVCVRFEPSRDRDGRAHVVDLLRSETDFGTVTDFDFIGDPGDPVVGDARVFGRAHGRRRTGRCRVRRAQHDERR